MKMEAPWLSLILIFAVINVSGQRGHFQMQALGRTAQLGEYYDAVTETFLGQSALREKLPKSLVKTIQVPWMNSRFETVDNQSEKRKKLGLNVSLYISIMMGLIKISGSAGYTKEDQDDTKSITSYLLYETRTVKDAIDFFLDDLQSLVNMELLSSVDATHIVTSIEFGANAVVEFKDSHTSFKDTETICAKFSAQVLALAGLVGAEAGAEINLVNHWLTDNSDVAINIYGDIPAKTSSPQNLQEVIAYIKDITILTKDYNDGKGKPIVYTLFPIDAIRKKFFVAPTSNVSLQDVEPTLTHRLAQLTDVMEDTKLLLKELVTDVNAFSVCITTEDLQRVNHLNQDYLAFSETFKGKVREALIAVRGGTPNDYLRDIITSYEGSPMSAMNVKMDLRENFSNVTEKLGIYKTFILSEKTEYWNTLSSLALVNPGKNVYVMLYSPRLVHLNPKIWLDTSSIFLRLAKVPSNHMIVLDCDFPSANCSNVDTIQLRQYRDGKLISDDVDQDLKFSKRVEPIRVPAVGRLEALGALYDANTGKFVSTSILDQSSFDVNENMEYEQESRIIFPKSFREKMDILQYPPDVLVQVLSQVVECQNTCEFIRNHVSSQKITGIYSHTVKSNVDTVLNLVLAEGLDLTAALDSGATHFVHQIVYGARTLVEVEVPENTDGNENLLKFDLEDLRVFTEAGLDNTTDNTNTKDFNMKSEGSIRVYSDVLESNLDFLKDKNGFKYFIKNLQLAISSIDQAKGVPIAYVLEPFQNFEVYFGALKPHHFQLPVVRTPEYKQIVRSYEEIMEVQGEIARWRDDFHDNIECVLDEEQELLERIQSEFSHQFSVWMTDLQVAVNSVNRQEKFELLKNLTNYDISKSVVLAKLEADLSWTMFKVELLHAGKKNNIGYSGRKVINLSTEPSIKTYIFHLKREFQKQIDLWSKNLFMFHSFNLPDNQLFFLDCDFHDSSCNGITSPVVHEYIRGNKTCDDVLNRKFEDEALTPKEEEIKNLENITTELTKKLEDMAVDTAEKLEDSRNRTNYMAIETCGNSKEYLLENFDRLICQPVPTICSNVYY